MPLDREQRLTDRITKTFNWNKREMLKRQSDADLINREFRRIEAKAQRMKAFEALRWARELKRRQREEEQEAKRRQKEDEVKI